MQLQKIEDKIEDFLQKKYRYSKSYDTLLSYKLALKKFRQFLKDKHSLDLDEAISSFEKKKLDPIAILDEFYSYLSNFKRDDGKTGYSDSTITTNIVVAKEFLNSQNLHIYNEDVKQRFRLPKKHAIHEEGLTKEILVRLLHNSPQRLQLVILMCISSGMRIGELVQLKLNDIDFSTNPTSIYLRPENTKTSEPRFTCISSEATILLKDYLRANFDWSEKSKEDKYLFMSNERDYSNPNEYYWSLNSAKCSLVQSLSSTITSIPELCVKNSNGRRNIHFHAMRAFFKTQVTLARQSDFAEALMGHKSLKLVYFRQNSADRLKTYLEVEPMLTVSDFSKVNANMEEMKSKIKFLETELEKVKQWKKVTEDLVSVS